MDTTERDARMVQRYSDGESLKVIAQDYGMTVEGVRQVLVRHGIGRRGAGAYRAAAVDARIDKDEMIARYLAGESYEALAKRYGVSWESIRNRLKAWGVYDPDRPSLPRQRHAAVRDRVAALARAGMSQHQIAREVGCSQSAISPMLREAGVVSRPRGHWTTRSRNGQVQKRVTIFPDDDAEHREKILALRQQAAELYASGLSVAQVAREIDHSWSQTWRLLKDAGVTRRATGEGASLYFRRRATEQERHTRDALIAAS